MIACFPLARASRQPRIPKRLSFASRDLFTKCIPRSDGNVAGYRIAPDAGVTPEATRRRLLGYAIFCGSMEISVVEQPSWCGIIINCNMQVNASCVEAAVTGSTLHFSQRAAPRQGVADKGVPTAMCSD